jgi:prepilin-type N-terminal cleavage/methylation domain-containing protein
MRRLEQRGFSLVEILIVIAILGVITVAGYRSLMYFTKEATQISRSAANSRRAEFDRLTGLLDDRLSRSWNFTVEPSVFRGLSGRLLHLFDADDRNFADFGVYTDGLVYSYTLADTGAPSLSFEYAFTNQNSEADYTLTLVTNIAPIFDVTANWQIPPPFYYRATTAAFGAIFPSVDQNQLELLVSEHRTNHTGLLQHDLREYHFTPRNHAFR